MLQTMVYLCVGVSNKLFAELIKVSLCLESVYNLVNCLRLRLLLLRRP